MCRKIDEKIKGAIRLREDESFDDEVVGQSMSAVSSGNADELGCGGACLTNVSTMLYFLSGSQAEIEEISKQVSIMFSGAAAGPAGIDVQGSKSATAAAGGQRKDFRQRRLTFAMQRDRSTSAAMEPTTTIYRSAEIGEVRDVTPPFPGNVLGTYSCHGIEPSWSDEGFTEKINQDRGCVVHPFRQSLREAVFCVFDGAAKCDRAVHVS